ncbi:DUF488 domain-containing protein [Poriferisphaera sp. WC338]|uniref:DUF488 domain-containing protein n=1 Tax=Poriferisphaera sp. WC338 TaxID=3425129 RepID=UPI003D816A20
MQIQIKRVYEERDKSDGFCVLVDRLWPRGIRKDAEKFDVWGKDLAPSRELREAFHGEDCDFDQFSTLYLKELKRCSDAADMIFKQADAEGSGVLTLMYAAKDEIHNHAAVLQSFLKKHYKKLHLP